MSDITLHIGDVFEQLAKIPDGSIDLIVTSPPFLALRSYLPDDHPDKAKEIGSQKDTLTRQFVPTGQDGSAHRIAETVGWTDCECSDDGTHWRTGRVLDPFAGSGTTLVAAHNESRDAIGIDLDSRNVAMVEDRLGPLVAACDLTVFT